MMRLLFFLIVLGCFLSARSHAQGFLESEVPSSPLEYAAIPAYKTINHIGHLPEGFQPEKMQPLGIDFVRIPNGWRMIGSNSSRAEARCHPQVPYEHKGNVWVSTYLVDQELFKLVMNENMDGVRDLKPDRLRREHAASQSMALGFCTKLERLLSSSGRDFRVRLLYEREWEYLAYINYGRHPLEEWTLNPTLDRWIREYETFDGKPEELSVLGQNKPGLLGLYDVLSFSEWCMGRLQPDTLQVIADPLHVERPPAMGLCFLLAQFN